MGGPGKEKRDRGRHDYVERTPADSPLAAVQSPAKGPSEVRNVSDLLRSGCHLREALEACLGGKIWYRDASGNQKEDRILGIIDNNGYPLISAGGGRLVNPALMLDFTLMTESDLRLSHEIARHPDSGGKNPKRDK